MLTTLKKKLARHLGIALNKDQRSRRVVVVIECILNQNARDNGAAELPAMNAAVINLCQQYDIGIMQMPCPEIACLGFSRERPPGVSLKDALDTEKGRACCRSISVDIAQRIQEYLAQAYQVLAILGGNAKSPGCAVHQGTGNLLPSSGILMQELDDELRKRGLAVPFRGIRDADANMMAEDIAWLEDVLKASVNESA